MGQVPRRPGLQVLHTRPPPQVTPTTHTHTWTWMFVQHPIVHRHPLQIQTY